VIELVLSRMRRFVVMSDASAFSLAEGRNVADKASQARLDQMFRDFHERIWRTLRRLGMSPEASADATQQAYLIAAERLDDIRAGSERAFLFGTAIRLARGAHRSGKRVDLDEDMDRRESTGSRVEELVDRRRAVSLADRVLSEMDANLLEVFVLFELEGMTTPEIAELTAVPLGTAASRLRRAREAFRAAATRIERSLLRPEVK
jgi:RNA polymerase sigma-70 factor, ECF subfamily